MIIEISLTSSQYIFHNEIVELPEDKVELLFKSTPYSVGRLTLTVLRGEVEKQYKITPGTTIDVSDFFELPGEVRAAVTLSVRGKVVRTWQVEPFIVKGVPGGVEAIPAIVELTEHIKVLEKAVIELSKIINDK